jgi:1,2-phenylacetyl-CoA epoxidase catalytic subunit
LPGAFTCDASCALGMMLVFRSPARRVQRDVVPSLGLRDAGGIRRGPRLQADGGNPADAVRADVSRSSAGPVTGRSSPPHAAAAQRPTTTADTTALERLARPERSKAKLSRIMALTAEAFVAELDAQNEEALARIARAASAGEPSDAVTVPKLLLLALKNELEATECAATWIPTTPEVNVKLALARQAGDEAKHYRMIQARLGELGVDTAKHDPLATGKSPLLAWLSALEGTVARVAAGQFTREALAVVRNGEFVRYCRAMGDEATARMYEETIQPDEKHHHELGRRLLLELATTEAAQAAAREASRKVLSMAEELQEIARLKMGISRAPGC